MHQRLQTLYAKRMKKLRQATVEPVLGTLINFMGIRRIWTRGLKNANKFMLGAAVAYNLKKWLNYTEQKPKTAVISLKMTAESLCFRFFAVCYLTHQHNKDLSTFLPPIEIQKQITKLAYFIFSETSCATATPVSRSQYL